MTQQSYELSQWPADEIEHLGLCPLCRATDRKLLYDDLTDVLFYCAPGKWSLYQCEGCGAAYVDPRPSPGSMHLAYRKYYTHEQGCEASLSKNTSGAQGFSGLLGNGYRNWRYGTDFKPSSLLGIVAAYLVPSLKTSIDVSYRYLPREGKGKRVLDVGCGGGVFLDHALGQGWDVAGVDTDPVSVENANQRGLNVRLGTVDVFSGELASFDYITISHVIEHVHEPMETLQWAWKLLKPGGRLWIDTPNIDSFGYAHFGKYWLGVDSPRHLVIFGCKAIQAALHKSGFRIWRYIDRSNAALGVFPLSEQVKEHVSSGSYPFSEPPPRANWAAKLAAIQTKLFGTKRAEFITLIAKKC